MKTTGFLDEDLSRYVKQVIKESEDEKIESFTSASSEIEGIAGEMDADDTGEDVEPDVGSPDDTVLSFEYSAVVDLLGEEIAQQLLDISTEKGDSIPLTSDDVVECCDLEDDIDGIDFDDDEEFEADEIEDAGEEIEDAGEEIEDAEAMGDDPEAMGDDVDPEAMGDDVDPEAMGDDVDPEAGEDGCYDADGMGDEVTGGIDCCDNCKCDPCECDTEGGMDGVTSGDVTAAEDESL